MLEPVAGWWSLAAAAPPQADRDRPPRSGCLHFTLADPYPRTPALAAGIADHVWTCEEIAALLD